MADLTWATLGKSSGMGNDTVSVTVSENNTIYSREGFIKAETQDGSGIVKEIKVLQYGRPCFKIDLTFVGRQQGSMYKLYSYYYTFSSELPTSSQLDFTVGIRLQDNGVPIEFPDGKSTLDIPLTQPKGATTGSGKEVLSTPFSISSKTALSYYGIMKAELSGKYIVCNKDTSTVQCEDEELMVDTSTISASASESTYTVTIGTNDSTEWTVE